MSRHLKSLAFVAAFLLLLTFVPGRTTVSARQASTVKILVSVTDKQGAAVPDLKVTDFTIREDGKQQTIASVTNASPAPLSVVLLLDKSGSTHNSTREMAKALDASIDFFRSVSQPGRDKVALVSFDQSVALDQDFTDDSRNWYRFWPGLLADLLLEGQRCMTPSIAPRHC
jgi:VWFA-related protein